MWLALPLVVIVLLAVIGGIIAGGIYAIVLLPIAFILAVFGVAYVIWARSKQAPPPDERHRDVDPLPHSGHSNTAPTPTTPDQLVDAQRSQQ